jgi:hypothetical protein
MTVSTIIDWIVDNLPFIGTLKKSFKHFDGEDFSDYVGCDPHTPKNPFPCSGGAAAAISQCKDCIDKQLLPNFLPLILAAGVDFAYGAVIGKLTWDVFKEILQKGLQAYLEKKGVALSGYLFPGLGILMLLGDLIDIIFIIYMMVKIWKAADKAKSVYCVCP